MDPVVSVGMIDIPVAINQMCYGIRAQAVESLQNSCFGYGESRIDQKLAILACENGDISTGSFNYTDIAAKWSSCDFCLRCCVNHRRHDSCFAWCRLTRCHGLLLPR